MPLDGKERERLCKEVINEARESLGVEVSEYLSQKVSRAQDEQSDILFRILQLSSPFIERDTQFFRYGVGSKLKSSSELE